MSITDELRSWAEGNTLRAGMSLRTARDQALAIADRIDAEHEQQMRERKGCIHYDQERHYCNVHDLTTEDYKRGYDDGFASADDWLAQHEDAMAEHGWVKLPVSEDGDVLHIGELVDEKLPFGGYAAPAPIDTMELSRGASGYRWMVKLDAESRALISPKLLRHHHEPTVEDVLREFAERVCNSGHRWGLDAADTIAEYAAKLRLAGDAE